MRRTELVINKLAYISKQAKYILKLLQNRGPVTKNIIIELTKMKLSTLNRVMQPLIDDSLIIESEVGSSTGGRKPVLYDINPKGYYVVGIDISRTYIQIVITNMKMEIIMQQLFTQCYSPQITVKLVSESINSMLGQLSISKSFVLGIGVGQ